MAYAQYAHAPIEFKEKAPRAQRSLFRRLLDTLEESNRRRAEREIARYIGGSSAKFTDESECEIERRFLNGSHF